VKTIWPIWKQGGGSTTTSGGGMSLFDGQQQQQQQPQSAFGGAFGAQQPKQRIYSVRIRLRVFSFRSNIVDASEAFVLWRGG
jgi:hypothetical protein